MTDIEPKLISIVGDKPLPKYYVYFDEWTGEIKNVANRYKKSEFPHLLTEDNAAAQILMGELNPKKYLVNDTPDGRFIMLKSDMLRILKQEEALSKIMDVPLSVNSEINIILYVESSMLEININSDTVFRMTGTLKNKGRKWSKAHNINNSVLLFYIIEKDNPLNLIHTIEIDPIDLINQGYMLYDLTTIVNKVGLRNVDVLTKRIFKSYGLKFKSKYVTSEYLTRKNQRRNSRVISKTSASSTFTVSQSVAGWTFKSNFTDPHEHKIYHDINIYVTGTTPFELRDKFTIPYTEIGHGKEFIHDSEITLDGANVLLGEEGKNITFNYEEIE